MNVLFVHGMGRTVLSWTPTLIRFRSRGLKTFVFGYSVSLRDFPSIVRRLAGLLEKISRQGDYVVIGHSLGGVLLRAALTEMPAGSALPKRMFLLGSPVIPPRLAGHLGRYRLFRAVTRDCGKLLGSEERMSSVPAAGIPTVAIAGTRGLRGSLSPFGTEPNDGIVAVGEVCADWISEVIRVPVAHTLLPSSPCVSRIILERLMKDAATPSSAEILRHP